MRYSDNQIFLEYFKSLGPGWQVPDYKILTTVIADDNTKLWSYILQDDEAYVVFYNLNGKANIRNPKILRPNSDYPPRSSIWSAVAGTLADRDIAYPDGIKYDDYHTKRLPELTLYNHFRRPISHEDLLNYFRDIEVELSNEDKMFLKDVSETYSGEEFNQINQ